MASIDELELQLFKKYEELCVKKRVKEIAVKIEKIMKKRGDWYANDEDVSERKARTIAIKKYREKPFYEKYEDALTAANAFCEEENKKYQFIKIKAVPREIPQSKNQTLLQSQGELYRAKYSIKFEIESKLDKKAATEYLKKNKTNKKTGTPDYKNKGVIMSLSKKIKKLYEEQHSYREGFIEHKIQDAVPLKLSEKDFLKDRNGRVKSRANNDFTRSINKDFTTSKTRRIVNAGALLNVSPAEASKAVLYERKHGSSLNKDLYPSDSYDGTLSGTGLAEGFILEAIRIANETGEVSKTFYENRLESSRAKTLKKVIETNDPEVIGPFTEHYYERIRTEEEKIQNLERLRKETAELDDEGDEALYAQFDEDFDPSAIDEIVKEQDKSFKAFKRQIENDVKYYKEHFIDEETGRKFGESYIIDVHVMAANYDSRLRVEEMLEKNNSPTSGGMMLGERESETKSPYLNSNKPIMIVDSQHGINSLYIKGSDKEKFESEDFKRFKRDNKEVSLFELENWLDSFNSVDKHKTFVGKEFGKHNRVEDEIYQAVDSLKAQYGNDKWKYAQNINIYRRFGPGIPNVVEFAKLQEREMPEIRRRAKENFEITARDYINKISHEASVKFKSMSAFLAKRNYRRTHSINPSVSIEDLNYKFSRNLDKAIRKIRRISSDKTMLAPTSAMEINDITVIEPGNISINIEKEEMREFGPQVENQPFISVTEVATPARKKLVLNRNKQRVIRKSGLKPLKLPVKVLKNYLAQREYGDFAAACFFQILVSNTPIDEPYHYKRRVQYYRSKKMSPYKYDKNPLYNYEKTVYNPYTKKNMVFSTKGKGWKPVIAAIKNQKEYEKEKEASRELVTKEYNAFHNIDDDIVRDCWEFRYKGHTFKSSEKRFRGLFDIKADQVSIEKIAFIFNKATRSSKVKSISFSYTNTNPRWEQLEYGGYSQNYSSGPWTGEGKYQFKHGVKEHFTYQAPKGYLRLIEAQWNALMESEFDIKRLSRFINHQGFKVDEVGKELINELKKYSPTLGTRNYDTENLIYIEG